MINNFIHFCPVQACVAPIWLHHYKSEPPYCCFFIFDLHLLQLMFISVMEVIELKVRLHCKACEKAVRKALYKTKGVTCVETDVILNKIMVMGYLDHKVIVKVIRKTGRKAEMWPSSCRRENSAGFVSVVPKAAFVLS